MVKAGGEGESAPQRAREEAGTCHLSGPRDLLGAVPHRQMQPRMDL